MSTAEQINGWIETAYEVGRTDGWWAGWQAAQDAEDAAWRHVAEVTRGVSQRPTYAELCERRGEPERAEANRRLLRERGVSA